MIYADEPWRLVQNKISRYPGGRELDRFRGIEPPRDDGCPEAWIGSVTPVKNAREHGDPNEGCARCILPNGRSPYLMEAIEADPEAVLGREHLSITGKNLGLLVKLLDAQHQLVLQCHPTRSYAKEWFQSPFGKTECWYIIATRHDTQEAPYVLLGFKEGVSAEAFASYYDNEDIHMLEDCCHKIRVKPGEMYFVDAGVPHAVGPGCLLVEVQEPSDITVGVRKLPQGATQDEQDFHRQRLLGAYRYEGRSLPETLQRLRVMPHVLRDGTWGQETLRIGPAQTPYFSMTEISAQEQATITATGFPQVGLVLFGGAQLQYASGALNLLKADEFFIPAGVRDMKLAPGTEGVKLVLCHPQGAIDHLLERERQR